MENSNFEEIILNSLETLAEKKLVSKDMNQAIKDASGETGVDAGVLRRVKDYNYYYGNGWEGTPLILDKEEKFKDRISPCFRKLLTIIDDLAQVDHLELLDEYVKAMDERGIHITFDKYIPEVKTSNKEVSDNAIEIGKSLQGTICSLSDRIREEDSSVAEERGFGPKKEYAKLISLAYAKNRKNKDIEDKCQDAEMNLNLALESYQYIQHN